MTRGSAAARRPSDPGAALLAPAPRSIAGEMPSPPDPPALPRPDLEQLAAEARHHRQRYDLYRARALSAKPVSQARLRELERVAVAAAERLEQARRG